jgi:hypothetical protein
MDWEFKGSPVLLFTAISDLDEFGKPIFATAERFFVATGSNSGVESGDLDGATQLLDGDGNPQCEALVGTDNPNDSGAFDNCRVVIEGIHARQLHAQVVEEFGGAATFEGGGDWLVPSVMRSEFDLVRVDADIACGEGLSTTSGTPGISGFLQAVRLNEGCAEQPFLATSADFIFNSWKVLWAQNAGLTVAVAATVEWDTEVPSSDATTRVTWSDVPDDELDAFWAACDDEGTGGFPPCFVLEECLGTPLRFCGADATVNGTACVRDADCSAAGEGKEFCVLTELLEPLGDPEADPEIPPGFPDMDDGTEGDQYMCFFEEHLTYLGTSGLNGVLDTTPEDTELQGDDTAEDRHLIRQKIFIHGDARGGRQ